MTNDTLPPLPPEVEKLIELHRNADNLAWWAQMDVEEARRNGLPQALYEKATDLVAVMGQNALAFEMRLDIVHLLDASDEPLPVAEMLADAAAAKENLDALLVSFRKR